MEFQLTTGPWPEVGYKFGRHGGEDTRSGKCGNCVEVCFSTDSGECQRRHDVNDGPSIARSSQSMVALSRRCPIPNGRAKNEVGEIATDITSASSM